MGVSTLVMNKLGTLADKKRRQYNEEKRQLLAQQQLEQVLNKNSKDSFNKLSVLQKTKA